MFAFIDYMTEHLDWDRGFCAFNDGDGENHDPVPSQKRIVVSRAIWVHNHCLSELTLSDKRVIIKLLFVQQFDVCPYSFSLGYQAPFMRYPDL